MPCNPQIISYMSGEKLLKYSATQKQKADPVPVKQIPTLLYGLLPSLKRFPTSELHDASNMHYV